MSPHRHFDCPTHTHAHHTLSRAQEVTSDARPTLFSTRPSGNGGWRWTDRGQYDWPDLRTWLGPPITHVRFSSRDRRAMRPTHASCIWPAPPSQSSPCKAGLDLLVVRNFVRHFVCHQHAAWSSGRYAWPLIRPDMRVAGRFSRTKPSIHALALLRVAV